MLSNLPNEHANEKKEISSSSGVQQLPLLPFAVQLQNIFPVEVATKRFPIDKAIDMTSIISTAHIDLNLSDLGIDVETLQAQIHLEVRVNFPHEPRLFEIYFKLVGIFSYEQEYQPEMVQYFLQQGSLSVMLPSARELLLSLCNRLQVPVVVLPLIQLASPPPPPPTEIDSLLK